MSPSNSGKTNPPARGPARRSIALQYGKDDVAPVVIASGMGYLAEKIVDVAQEHGVPIYEDDSLATMLSQLQLGQAIPEELYQAIVEIYVYFLNFDPANGDRPAHAGTAPQPSQQPPQETEMNPNDREKQQ